jgi:hypothetical protein
MRYYIHLNGENKGPFNLEGLQKLVADGYILASTYVAAEGSQNWVKATEVPSLFSTPATPLPPNFPNSGPSAPPVPPPPTITAEDVAQHVRLGAQKAFQYSVNLTSQSTGFWGAVIKTAKGILNEKLLCVALERLAKIGIFAMVAAALGALTSSILLAVRNLDGLSPTVAIGVGIFTVGLISLIQYFASRFMNSGEQVISASPTKMGSEALTEAIALVSLIPAILLMAAYAFCAVKFEIPSLLIGGMSVLFSGSLTAGIALNPKMLNITIDEKSSAGESAIGIISFYFKSALRAIPAIFGVTAISGTIAVIWGTVKVLTGDTEAGLLSLGIGLIMVIIAGLLPVCGLLFFLFGHLLIDVVSSILELPSKLEKRM